MLGIWQTTVVYQSSAGIGYEDTGGLEGLWRP